MTSIQFPLQFEFQADKGFDSFYSGRNQAIINELKQLISGAGEQHIFLYGKEGYGKSHLLQASCQFAHQKGLNPFYYPFQKRNLPTLNIFDGLEEVKLVCFDNVDKIAEQLEWEQACLNFLDQHLENNYRWILTARSHPDDINVRLPDLKQHLTSGLALKLEPFADDESVSALICKANYMGITITPKVGHFLLTHYASDLASLWVLLSQLDKATLSAQRKLTIPFLKKIMEE